MVTLHVELLHKANWILQHSNSPNTLCCCAKTAPGRDEYVHGGPA